MKIEINKKRIQELLIENNLKSLPREYEHYLCLYIINNFNIKNILQEVIDSISTPSGMKVYKQSELNKKIQPKPLFSLSNNTVYNKVVIDSKIFKKYDNWTGWGSSYIILMISTGGIIYGNSFGGNNLNEDEWNLNINNIYFFDGILSISFLNEVDENLISGKSSFYEHLIQSLINLFTVEINRLLIDVLKDIKLKEGERLKKLQVSQTNVLSELDKDGNGEVDVVEGNDFNTLLKKHQKSIVEVDRNYVQQFVKVSSYLKTKKGNIQSIFNSIKDTPNQQVLNEYVEILKDDIHTYNLVLFNSLNMIVSLVEDDMITFYEIHEMFDTINMFDSKHEKDISQKLTNIGDGLENLMYEIRDMSNQISDSIDELSYVTEESNEQLTNKLSEIDSTLKVGNLISTINTYQNYKTNRRLNS